MPIGLAQAPPSDLDGEDANAASLPVPQSLRYGMDANFGQWTSAALNIASKGAAAASQSLGFDLSGALGQGQPLTADQANEQYGVDNYLRFNQPVTPGDAAFQSSAAHERRFRDIVLSRTNPNPLMDFGSGLAGALVDPVSLGVMIGTGGLGDAAIGALSTTDAAGALGATIAKLGKVGNAASAVGRTVAAGALNNAPYVGADMALHDYVGDDYSFGDGLRDIAAAAILHTGVHFLGEGLGSAAARLRADPAAPPAPDVYAPAAGVPPDVSDLPPAARTGAFVKAVDDAAADRPVDVGQYVQRELTPADPNRLDEPTAEPAAPSFRPLAEDTAITTRGSEVPVRYGLVELGDLVTSHDDNLTVNPNFPAELQPRDRARAGAQARNYQLEAELNPKLLMNDAAASGGAPIVAPDGVVESGNGRTIALRRSAAAGGEAYARYQAELQARGLDTTGMKQPVLVRMRTQPMEGGARAALAREMNADVTERMSASEQAMSDAQRIPDTAFDLVKDNEGPATSRDFARAFIDRAAPDQVNQLTAADGTLSPEGARRIKAAVLARAYGDPRLVGQIFEDEAAPARQLAEGLAEAAPAWARMRAAAGRGEIPRELEITAALNSAMDLVRFAKQEGAALAELLAERLGQKDLFGGEAISPVTEALLRLMYRDEALTKPMAAARIALALRYYAGEALKAKPGPDLFGDIAGEDTSRQILANLADRFARGDAGPLDIRPPGKSQSAGEPPKPVVLDLRPPGGERPASGPSLSRSDGGGAEGQGGEPGASAGKPARLTGEQIIAADPELKALADDTAAYAQSHGLDPAAADAKSDPNVVAEAIRAAAFCIAEGGE